MYLSYPTVYIYVLPYSINYITKCRIYCIYLEYDSEHPNNHHTLFCHYFFTPLYSLNICMQSYII